MKVDEVHIYVEGESDRRAMEVLLKPLIDRKKQNGISIKFFAPFHGKSELLNNISKRAVNILKEPNKIVVVIPDFYPVIKGYNHENFKKLERDIIQKFYNALENKRRKVDDRYKEHFKVFCFKYDLKVLILASGDIFFNYFKITYSKIPWKIPVEDQNHKDPPKKVIEKICKKYGKKYNNVDDAPKILEMCDYHVIADQCPQCFKPFVDFLERL